MDEYGTIEDYKYFKCFPDSQRVLDGNQLFQMLKSTELHAKLPLNWENKILFWYYNT